jgi:hypothetical protein
LFGWRHGTDLNEDVKRVELVPMLDEASVLDPPDVDRTHGEGIACAGVAEEVSRMRALVALAADYAGTVRRDKDVFCGHLEVGHTRDDGAEDFL